MRREGDGGASVGMDAGVMISLRIYAIGWGAPSISYNLHFLYLTVQIFSISMSSLMLTSSKRLADPEKGCSLRPG